MLKENNEKWKNETANEKENCLDFMLEILNIKISSEEDQDNIDRQLILIADLIQRHFSSLTIPEIKEAMRMYVAKKLNGVKVFRLIDCVSIGEILNAYIEFRNEASEQFIIKRQKLLNEPIEKTQSEKEEIFNDFIKMIFEEVYEKGYSDSAWYIFKELEVLKKINISNEEKEILYKKELAIYVPEERQRLIKQNPLNFKSLISEFEKTYKDKNRPIYVKNRCRSILVSTFIKESIKTYQELQILIHQYKV